MQGLFGNQGEQASGEKSPEGESSSNGAGLDPRIMMGILDLLGAVTGEEDSDRLIAALRPFVSRERADSIDEALRVMKLVRAARAAMKLWGREEGGGKG